MTNNLQDRFRERFDDLLYNEEIDYIDKRDRRLIEDFIISEVEQAKKDLLTELLSEAPEDKGYSKEYTCICDYGEPCENCLFGMFNQSNNQWRTLLESKLK